MGNSIVKCTTSLIYYKHGSLVILYIVVLYLAELSAIPNSGSVMQYYNNLNSVSDTYTHWLYIIISIDSSYQDLLFKIHVYWRFHKLAKIELWLN